jgi:GAF domain-containing protein
VSAGLLETLTALAMVRLGDKPAAALYQTVADAALDLVPGADAVILALGPPEQLRVVASAGTLDPSRLDQAAGPGRQAVTTGDLVHARGDLSIWPGLAAAAGSAGLRDVLAAPLVLGPRHQGSLSFFATVRPLDGPDLATAEAFAAQAAAVVANTVALDELRRANDQLSQGIRSRETVGLAKGILMRQEACSEIEAFRILVAASQRLNRKVRDVARDVIALTEGRADLKRGSGD